MSKRGKKNKHKDQKSHAIRRSETRLGFRITNQEYQDLIKSIQNGEFRSVKSQSIRVRHFEITIRDKTAIAVYDNVRKTIVTFLVEEHDPIIKKIFGW